jgi:hypothetical protein
MFDEPQVLPKRECEQQFSVETISKAGLAPFQVRKQLPYGFKRDISCVGNPFKVSLNFLAMNFILIKLRPSRLSQYHPIRSDGDKH